MSELDAKSTQAHKGSTRMYYKGMGAIVAIISGIIVSIVCIATCTVITIAYKLTAFFQTW